MHGFLCGLFSIEGSVKGPKYVRLTIEMLEPRLIEELFEYLLSTDLNPHAYKYQKEGKMMHGLYLYGPTSTSRFLSEIGLIGAKRLKLVRFLTSLKSPNNSPEQPGGKG